MVEVRPECYAGVLPPMQTAFSEAMDSSTAFATAHLHPKLRHVQRQLQRDLVAVRHRAALTCHAMPETKGREGNTSHITHHITAPGSVGCAVAKRAATTTTYAWQLRCPDRLFHTLGDMEQHAWEGQEPDRGPTCGGV